MNVRIKKIDIFGSKREVETALAIIQLHLPVKLFDHNEPEARLKLQSLIDRHDIKATITWDGNRVWSKKKILKHVKMLTKKGVHILSDYLYEFFHLCCGSIAHYDKRGWISCYSDLESVKNFFVRNEYGQSVLAHQPWWASDRIEIIKEIYKLLGIKEAS